MQMPSDPLEIAIGVVALGLLAANIAGLLRDDLVASIVPGKRAADSVYGRRTGIRPSTIVPQPGESPLAFALRLTTAVNAYLIHFTPKGPAVRLCHNWLLWLLGAAGIGFFRLYEFQRPSEIERRGTGICSQHAWCLKTLLVRQGVPAAVAGYEGHVVVHTALDGGAQLLDADYGVTLRAESPDALRSPELLRQAYEPLGERRATLLAQVLARPYRRFGRGREVLLWSIDLLAALLKWAIPLSVLLAVSWS
jgi:hypothetical protein